MTERIVVRAEGVWKQYRYGSINHGTLRKDVQSWWARVRGKEDPNIPISRIDAAVNREVTAAGERFWALSDVSFSVREGEVLGIIGRNGAGKSTLLKILSRVTTPTRGWVGIKGRVASLLEVGTGFHPELSGRENIFLNGAILGMTKAEIRHRFDEIVSFAEIERFVDTPVKRYSSGMYVRLAFAVAAHLEAEILIVDEVLAVGDAAFQAKCLGKMNEAASLGKTILFVSHNISAVRTLCTRAFLIEGGRIINLGPANEVMDAYTMANFDRSTDVNPMQVVDIHRSQGSREVCLKRIGIQALNGAWKREFAVWEPFRVVLDIENMQVAPREAICWFAITTPDGTYIGTSIQYDDLSKENRIIEGYASIMLTAVCRDNILKPGTYFIAAGVIGRYKEILDWCDRLISFEVSHQYHERGILYDGRIGLIAMRSEWQSIQSKGSDDKSSH